MTNPAADIAPLPRLCCMISGGGRTVLNIDDAIRRGTLGAALALVISSSASVAGVQRCRDRGIPVVIQPGVIPRDDLHKLLRTFQIDAVALAGYLKLLHIPDQYRGRIVNIHPSLLPKFGGKGMHGHHVHEAVLACGERESGCTVHLVDDTYDTGDTLLQMRCPVMPGDTPDSLAARVFGVECQAYPLALQQFLDGVGRLEARL